MISMSDIVIILLCAIVSIVVVRLISKKMRKK